MLSGREWSVPVVAHQFLSGKPGVSCVPKHSTAKVLQQVGYTASPVGIVTVQSPQPLGLRGYPRQRISCHLSIMSSDGEHAEVLVERWLTQLGFGPHVEQVMDVPEVTMYNSMKAMVVKFSVKQGWPAVEEPQVGTNLRQGPCSAG